MVFDFRSINYIEVEITTNCNAACPQCFRNHNGGKTIASLPKINWSLKDFQKAIPEEVIKQLKMIYFCGTYGDPLANKSITSMVRYIKQVNADCCVSIHTNGGVGSKKTFQDLAEIVDSIAFGIDGLEDTNHIYRRNVKWSKLMSNVDTFIQAGGEAHWDYIVFKHNQDQVEQARQLSQSLGFKNFNIKKTRRFLNNDGKTLERLAVQNNKGNFEYYLELPEDIYKNSAYNQIESLPSYEEYLTTTKISCFWMHNNGLYISAEGHLFPCGWLADRLYGVDSESSLDHIRLKQMIDSIGGKKAVSVFERSIKDLVNGDWFKLIEKSWSESRLRRCAVNCGTIRSTAEQNTHILYKLH